MAIPAAQALWFLPFVLPICFYVAFTDLAYMRITNPAVVLLALIFALVGLFLMPFQDYLWRLAALVIVLVCGIVLNAAGAMGAGDAKFVASAAPFVALSDFFIIVVLLCASILGAVATHRISGLTPIRRMVPHWESWTTGVRFPMGFPLAMTLSFYLGLVWLLR